MYLIAEIIAFVALCWLLIAVFRLLINMIERCMDISSKLEATRQNHEVLTALDSPEKIQKKAA